MLHSTVTRGSAGHTLISGLILNQMKLVYIGLKAFIKHRYAYTVDRERPVLSRSLPSWPSIGDLVLHTELEWDPHEWSHTTETVPCGCDCV